MPTLPPMSCVKSFILGWKNYAKFTGRARRSEFFYFYFIINVIKPIFFLLYYIQLLNDDFNYDTYRYENEDDYIGYLYIFWIIFFVTFLPNLGLQVRRLHDTGRTGWLVLLRLSLIVGDVFLLYFFCIDSERTTNDYGPSPKYVSSSINLKPENNYNPPVALYPQSDPVVAPVTVNPTPYQQPPYTPQNTPYSQETPNQQPAPYQSMNDTYSKPTPMQPPSETNY